MDKQRVGPKTDWEELGPQLNELMTDMLKPCCTPARRIEVAEYIKLIRSRAKLTVEGIIKDLSQSSVH